MLILLKKKNDGLYYLQKINTLYGENTFFNTLDYKHMNQLLYYLNSKEADHQIAFIFVFRILIWIGIVSGIWSCLSDAHFFISTPESDWFIYPLFALCGFLFERRLKHVSQGEVIPKDMGDMRALFAGAVLYGLMIPVLFQSPPAIAILLILALFLVSDSWRSLVMVIMVFISAIIIAEIKWPNGLVPLLTAILTAMSVGLMTSGIWNPRTES